MTPDVTTDSLFNGRLLVRQPKTGYRFSIDAVLLAHLASPRPQDRLVDLGTGCGVLSLILAFRFPTVRIRAVEIQPALAALAAENVRDNRLQERISVVQADLRRMHARGLGGPCDMVVCNPPYRRARSGKINPHPQKAVARHEIAASLRDVAAASARLMRKGGKLAVIYPAQRTADLIAEMRASAVEPKTLRMIHSRSGAEAKLVFVEGAAGGRPGMTVAPPLVVYRKDRSYTPEVETMLRGR